MSEPVLQVRALSVDIRGGGDRTSAVANVSFDVAPGEMVCLVGESGSGKSVTASSVMGLLNTANLRLSEGSIKLCGEELVGASKARLRELRGSRMAMVFQEPMTALNPVHRVGDQIAEVLRTHSRGMTRKQIRARVLELMRDVYLPEPERLQYSYPNQLSGGQRQRIVIAMALALKPALIIADEPTTALDVTTQAQILSLLRDLQTRYKTGVLFITHDLGVVAEIADRAIVMQSGRIVEEGPALEVLTRPKHRYTRMLLDALPVAVARPPRFEPDAPIVLAVKDLTKTYDERSLFRKSRSTKAVDGVSFDLRRGEIVGVVGESGSGKSTLARCIARLITVSDGRVEASGSDVAKLPNRSLSGYRRKLQMVFQDPYRSLNPRMTVAQLIGEGMANIGLSQREANERTRRLLDLIGLDHSVTSRYPHQFSGGQRQRICIARALAMEPEILIADEAVSALDVSVQAQVLDLLEDLRSRLNLAVIFITHDLRVAARICDTVAVMHRGKIVEYGRAVDVFAAPQHEYTKQLFAAAPGTDVLGQMVRH